MEPWVWMSWLMSLCLGGCVNSSTALLCQWALDRALIGETDLKDYSRALDMGRGHLWPLPPASTHGFGGVRPMFCNPQGAAQLCSSSAVSITQHEWNICLQPGSCFQVTSGTSAHLYRALSATFLQVLLVLCGAYKRNCRCQTHHWGAASIVEGTTVLNFHCAYWYPLTSFCQVTAGFSYALFI